MNLSNPDREAIKEIAERLKTGEASSEDIIIGVICTLIGLLDDKTFESVFGSQGG